MTARPNAPDLRALDDRYDILGELRARKDAQQFLAKRKSDGADVLITIISAPGGGENNALAHLASDVKLLSGLHHPGLLQTLEGRWLGSDAFAVVTQRVSGESLEELLSSGERLTNPRIASILEQVRGITDWARNNGIVHRGVTIDTLYIERDTHRLCTTLTVTPIPLEGLPDQCSDAQMIGALAWTLLTGEPYSGEESQRQLADMRPDLSTRLVAETEAMTRCRVDRKTPDLDTMIAVIATGDAWHSSESELARLEAEHMDAMRLAREQFEAEKSTIQQQLADETERIAAERAEFESQRQAELERLAADRAEWERTTAEERAEYERKTAEERAEYERTTAEERAAFHRQATEQRSRYERTQSEERAAYERRAKAEREELERRATEQQRQLTSLREELESRRVEIERLETEITSKHAELTAALSDMETRRIEIEQYLYEEQQRLDDEHDRIQEERDRIAEERARMAAAPAAAALADREVALDSTTDDESDQDDEDRAPPMARAVPELEPLPTIAPLTPVQPIAPLPPVPSLASLKPTSSPPADRAPVENELDDEEMDDRSTPDDVESSAPKTLPEDTGRQASTFAAGNDVAAPPTAGMGPAWIKPAGIAGAIIVLILIIFGISHMHHDSTPANVGSVATAKSTPRATSGTAVGVTGTAGGTVAPGLTTPSNDSSAMSNMSGTTTANGSVTSNAAGPTGASSSSQSVAKRAATHPRISPEEQRAREKAAVSAMQHDPGTAGEPDAYYGPPTSAGTSSVVPLRHDTVVRTDTIATPRPALPRPMLPPPVILPSDTARARPPVFTPRPDTLARSRPDTLVRPDTSSLASARPAPFE
jgi:chemotaxis protein histidine kinase CheA